jgi:sulfotransferase
MTSPDRIHFIAGLPRSGSTLLAALLRQNAHVHAAMSSPVEHIFSSAIASMSGQNYFYRFITDKQRETILRSIFESYYADTSQSWIFDTNRLWPSKLPALMHLFPETRVICCVRDLVSVVNSFEHLVINNPFSVSKLFGWDPRMNVYGRFEKLMSATGPIGRSLEALKEGYYGPYGHRLHFVEYDTLATKPDAVMTSIYSATGIPHFTHDFAHVSYHESGFDSILGLRDMHTIRSTVSPVTRNMILPDDIVEKLQNLEFWRNNR